MNMSGQNKTTARQYEQFQNEANTDYTTMNSYPTQTHDMPQVIVQPNAQPQVFSVEAAPPDKWSWCPVVTSVFALCCCQIFGIISMLAAIFSYVDHKSNDHLRARNKRGIAYGFGIAAIVIGSLCIIGGIIAASVIAASAAQAIQQSGYYDNYYNQNNG